MWTGTPACDPARYACVDLVGGRRRPLVCADCKTDQTKFGGAFRADLRNFGLGSSAAGGSRSLGAIAPRQRLAGPSASHRWGRFVPIDQRVAVESVNLPGDFHKDPADRFLVATARLLGATLISCDDKIRAYAHVNTFWS